MLDCADQRLPATIFVFAGPSRMLMTVIDVDLSNAKNRVWKVRDSVSKPINGTG